MEYIKIGLSTQKIKELTSCDLIEFDNAKYIRLDHLERVLAELLNDTSDVDNISVLKPPKPPLSRIISEDVGHFCTYCGSTVSKNGFLGLFGEMLCHNPKCPNSKSKKNYR
jgi:hypothetical protein